MPPAKRASSTPKAKKSTAAAGKAKPAGAKAAAKKSEPAATPTEPTPRTARATRATATTTAAARRVAAASGNEGMGSIADQLVRGAVHPKELVMLTRDRIQGALDDAAARGRVTRKDANELAAELVRRGRGGGDELVSEIEALLRSGREQLGTVTKRAARSEPVDRIIRGADRARRAAGVGSSFPISGYADLNVAQVQARLKELSEPELRRVLDYERAHANRKSVVGAIEKSL